MNTSTSKNQIAIQSSVLIDELIGKVNKQHDVHSEKLLRSKEPDETIKGCQEELKRRTSEIVDGLQALRNEILRHELSRKDRNQLETWFRILLDAISRYLQFPLA